LRKMIIVMYNLVLIHRKGRGMSIETDERVSFDAAIVQTKRRSDNCYKEKKKSSKTTNKNKIYILWLFVINNVKSVDLSSIPFIKPKWGSSSNLL
jgi:hypothetical protein